MAKRTSIREVNGTLKAMVQTSMTGTPISWSSLRHSSLCCAVTRTVLLLYFSMSASAPVCTHITYAGGCASPLYIDVVKGGGCIAVIICY